MVVAVVVAVVVVDVVGTALGSVVGFVAGVVVVGLVVVVDLDVVVGAFVQFWPNCSSSPAGQSTKLSHTQSMGIQ